MSSFIKNDDFEARWKRLCERQRKEDEERKLFRRTVGVPFYDFYHWGADDVLHEYFTVEDNFGNRYRLVSRLFGELTFELDPDQDDTIHPSGRVLTLTEPMLRRLRQKGNRVAFTVETRRDCWDSRPRTSVLADPLTLHSRDERDWVINFSNQYVQPHN